VTTSNSNNHLKKTGKVTGTFYFKQFKVEDGRSTMKVGTDAVLLGSVADVTKVANILEIGTGCGVIALILAQRSHSRIDAIAIDEESVKQAKENVMNSPWTDLINIIHSSLQEFIPQSKEKYDLIISNPPYFSRSLKSDDRKRNLSRHTDSLSFDELIFRASILMTTSASLWVILPVKESKEFMEIAGKSGLFIHFTIKITPKTGKAYHRIILQLKKLKAEKVEEKTLIIRNSDDSYSREYMDLTKEYYVDF